MINHDFGLGSRNNSVVLPQVAEKFPLVTHNPNILDADSNCRTGNWNEGHGAITVILNNRIHFVYPDDNQINFIYGYFYNFDWQQKTASNILVYKKEIIHHGEVVSGFTNVITYAKCGNALTTY